jgi:hypothetical protein
MSNSVLWAAAAIAVSAAAYRLLCARRALTPGVRYLCFAIAAVGLSAAVIAPGTLDAATRIEPFPNATRLLGNELALVAAFNVHGLLAHLALPTVQVRRVMRRQAVILITALATMTVLLGIAPTVATADFVSANAHNLRVLGYLLVFCTYIAIAAAQFIRLIHAYVQLSDRPWLRRGLSIIQLGAALGVVWAVCKSAAAGVVFATGAPVTTERPTSAVLSAGCVILVACGSTMPTWGPALARPLRWAHRYHTYRALRPLWLSLTRAFPETVHPATENGITPPGRGIEWKLARRLVEIRDGLLLLTPYRDPRIGTAVHAAALRANRSDPQAIAEATELHAALQRRRQGDQPPTETPPPPPPAAAPAPQPVGLDAETAWLHRVARAYRRATHQRARRRSAT